MMNSIADMTFDDWAHAVSYSDMLGGKGTVTDAIAILPVGKILKVVAKERFVADFVTKNTKNFSSYFNSEREARNLARTKLGKNYIEVEPNKFRSADGKWQYRAKPGDIKENHIHLEELNPNTGEILQNYHLRW